MKKFHFVLILLFISLIISAQTSPTGSSTEVGITEGQLSVSLSGGANYTVPIAVPPGINGVLPQVSLVYNSQGGNGIAGYGWNISGVSAITRTSSTKYHDGTIDPVDFDILDRFAFDGQRLIVKSGTAGVYGADGTVYETENFSNVKITSYGSHPSGVNYGPAYFIVEYPDGSKSYYGNSTDCRSATDWSISYWENPQGVRISYTYVLSNNILNISSIKYGARTTSAPINEIQFVYETRQRPEQAYIGGLSLVRDTILKELKVIGNAVGFRNYILDYDKTSLDYQRLVSITEKSGDGSKSYNPTVFEYQSSANSSLPLGAKEPANIDFSGINFVNTGYISGDFDTDGKIDIILYSPTGTDAKKKYWLYNNIIAGSANISSMHDVGKFEEIFPSTFLSSNNKVLPQGWVISKKTDTSYTFTTYGIGSTSHISEQYNRVVNFPTVVMSDDCDLNCNVLGKRYGIFSKRILSGDFNGDGLTDVIAIDTKLDYFNNCIYDPTMGVCGTSTTPQEMRSKKVYFIDLKRDNTVDFLHDSGELISDVSGSKVEVIDFDGDGKSDFIVFDSGFVKVYTLDRTNKLILMYQNTTSDSGIMLDRPVLMGDYNGDGKTDFVIPNAVNQDSWNFYLSNGVSFNKVNGAIGLEYKTSEFGFYGVKGWSLNDTYSLNERSYIANDYNGDGKTDILYQQNLTVEREGEKYDNRGTPQLTKLVLLENKLVTGNVINFSMINTPTQVAGIRRYPIAVFTNHNEVNQNLEYSLISDNKIVTFNGPKDNRKDVLVNSITTGNGVKEKITYNALKQDEYEPFYTPTLFVETFPNIDVTIAPSLKMVTKLEKSSKNVYKKQLFLYSGAVSNLEGLGFMGFRSTVRTNWHDDNTAVISSISKNDMSLRGANVENYTVLGLNTPLIPKPNEITTPSTIIKEGTYTVTGTENLVATQSITLKSNMWVKSGSTFSATINEDANFGTSLGTPSDFITKSLLTYESELLPNKVFKIKNTKLKQFNNLEGTGSESITEYDTNNNPIKSTTNLKEGSRTVQTSLSNISYHPSSQSPYIVGRPAGKVQTVKTSTDVMSSEELYTYSNSLLTQVKKKGTNTDYITEDNVYDVFGNITKKNITVPGLSTRITNYVYDTSGRFLIKSTDIEGISVDFVYNLSNGLLMSETDPYGLTTVYLYDSFFKKTKTTDYLGKSKTYNYTRSSEKTIITGSGEDGSSTEEIFDDLGRKIKIGSKNIMGTYSNVFYYYDIYDRNYKVSQPTFGLSPIQFNETKFDVYGRTIQNIDYTGKITNTSYSSLTTTINDGTKNKIITKNAIGNVVSITDAPGGTVNYTYFANGNLKESDYAGAKTVITQDGWGRKTRLVDSSAGTYIYEYNAFGETLKESTPNGITNYKFNNVGKLEEKTISGTNTNSKSTYTYDSSTKLIVSSKFEDLTNGANTITTVYTYDNSKRINKTTETTPYAVFTKELTYDGFGRVDTESSVAAAGGKSSGKIVRNTYKNGSHWQILDNETNAVLWQTNSVNDRGQLLTAQNGPITITNTYDTYGFVSQSKYDKTNGLTNILTLNTIFDVKKSNLTSRSNSLFGWNESFEYDALDRLTKFKNVQGVQETQVYDDRGRITQNNLGTYKYTKTDNPYQNTEINPTNEALDYYTLKQKQFISYNSFKSPVQIEETGIDKISFVYNDGNDRTAMFYGSVQDDKLLRPKRKYYSADGSMEIKHNIVTGVFEFTTYIGGDGYSAPIVMKSNGETQKYLYLQRDYQGSILAITDQSGAIIEKRLFDAWGAIIKVQDGAGNILTELTVLDRGYTGHEHLQTVGIINMNGRLYDPKLHRFLQPDNNIQDPSNTQNYNRYGYCWNNPLKYTDPSGEIVWAPIIAGAIIGAIIGAVGYGVQAIQTGNWSWGQFSISVLSGAAIGAITGGVDPSSSVLSAASVGQAVATGFVSAILPSYGVQVGDWSFNISPAIAFGNTSGIGASLSVGYSSGDFSFSAGVGIMSNSNYSGFGKNGLEIRKSILAAYDDGKTGVSLGTNFWSGDFKQQTGTLGLHFGDFRAQYENDGKPFSGISADGNDQYRTAALSLSVGEFGTGFNLFTGTRTKEDYYYEDNNMSGGKLGNFSIGRFGEYYKNGFVHERGTPYRMGAAYFSYKSYRVGVNSEWIRHAIQNVAIHGTFIANQRMFEMQNGDWNGYFQYKTSNIFTTW
ncbi:polymorphic toxin type 23 domain-containing protein [Flavobacterium sp. Fl-318]|uniref:Polymorphic toxin type 23 domain-containing protein n=1 Tax=Flavobacterium cupriresistens TaxID=2893885 RepID=A0ABU4R7H5_9FLAO|nr:MULTISPECIES: polymorphic toxin type 23 domain-containing protein [unclassified Flavobacterium]MDX6188498.1 polymorphic toxin type 23 domain-containing protein [Flavobacterium sp. Fl-318]UFH44831.1 polymorphic toxin type 23 domain-containing protein [Flavobacterium sp. F-323]